MQIISRVGLIILGVGLALYSLHFISIRFLWDSEYFKFVPIALMVSLWLAGIGGTVALVGLIGRIATERRKGLIPIIIIVAFLTYIFGGPILKEQYFGWQMEKNQQKDAPLLMAYAEKCDFENISTWKTFRATNRPYGFPDVEFKYPSCWNEWRWPEDYRTDVYFVRNDIDTLNSYYGTPGSPQLAEPYFTTGFANIPIAADTTVNGYTLSTGKDVSMGRGRLYVMASDDERAVFGLSLKYVIGDPADYESLMKKIVGTLRIGDL